ncbi:MAG: oligosaccharide flippase family protein [Bacteroidetes bacterium]|nr:oligosaccharide flippase family protein [Bacteroidota bacterium]
MSFIKKLASQTIYYGISSILARMLHFFIIPLQTRKLKFAELGLLSEIYAYIAVLNIMYILGMEFAFFRFSDKSNHNISKSFSCAFYIILFNSIFITSILFIFADDLVYLMGHKNDPIYIYFFATIILIDSLSAIPLAYLRLQNYLKKFISIQILKLVIFIFFNFLILYFFDEIYKGNILINYQKYILKFYDPGSKIKYLLLANIISSLLGLILSSNTFKNLEFSLDLSLIKKMLKYSTPFVLVGLVGVTNEMIIRISIKYLNPKNNIIYNEAVLGIFAQCFKLSLFMNLFIQAYRYAAEPFFFSQYKKTKFKEDLALLMSVFIISMCFVLFIISMNIDIISYLMLGSNFQKYIEIVPYAMLSYLFLGVYYNISSWFKITKKTYFAIIFTLSSFIISITCIIIFMPIIGYWANILAFLGSSLSMVIFSYLVGQIYFPVPYKVIEDSLYILFTIISIFILRKLMPNSLKYRFLYGFIITFISSISAFIYLKKTKFKKFRYKKFNQINDN